MSRIYELDLRVREADEADFERPIIRIHGDNKPQGIRWGDRINISMDRKNWITCQLEPAGVIGAGKIYISIHLRGLLNKDTDVNRIARLGVPCSFYIRKTSPWRVLSYIIIGIIVIIGIAFLVSLLR